MLRVSLRTLQNWLSGRHQVPYSVYKLLRMMRLTELPGQAWAGWHFSRGQLITPEGRSISSRDSSWWSLLVRQAHGFGELYRELQMLRHEVKAPTSGPKAAERSQVLLDGGAAAGLVSVSTTHTGCPDAWGQDGAIIPPWPTISDFPLPLTPLPVNAASASVSALTPCFASPSISTSGEPPQPLQTLPVPAKPGQSLPLLADSWLNRAYPRQSLPLAYLDPKNSASNSAGNSPGSNASPARADRSGGAA